MFHHQNYLSDVNINLDQTKKKNSTSQFYKNINLKKIKKNRISPNILYTKCSIFNNDFKNKGQNNVLLDNNNRDCYSQSEKRLINGYRSRSIDPDLDMMKIQLRCDLITQKIYQIQDQVQSLHESSIKDDLNLLLNKSKNHFLDDYFNSKYHSNTHLTKREQFKVIKYYSVQNKKVPNALYKSKNFVKNNNISEPLLLDYDQFNFLNGSNNINNDKNLKQINNKNNCQKNYYLLNNCSTSAPFINFEKFNTVNKTKVIKPQKGKIFNTDIHHKTYSQKIKDINTIRVKPFLKYSFNSNKRTTISNSNMIKYKNKINTKANNNRKNSSICRIKYGSYDKYFFNDNNYDDIKYLKFIQNIKNNISSINYQNLGKIKNEAFKQDEMEQINQINKMINKTKYTIQTENSIDIQGDNYLKEIEGLNKKQYYNNNLNELKFKHNNISLNLDKSLNKNKYKTIDKNKKIHVSKINYYSSNNYINKEDINKNSKSIEVNKEKNNPNNMKQINKCNPQIKKIDNNKEIINYKNQYISPNNREKQNSNNRKNNLVNKNFSSNSLSNTKSESNNDNIKFKININNVSNYNYKNNRLNFNNNNNKDKNKNENLTSIKNISKNIINESEINDNKIEENMELNHDYSKDDLSYNPEIMVSSNKEKSNIHINLFSDRNEINYDNTNNISNINISKTTKNKDRKTFNLNNSLAKKYNKIILKKNQENNNIAKYKAISNNFERNKKYNIINNYSKEQRSELNQMPKNLNNIFNQQNFNQNNT